VKISGPILRIYQTLHTWAGISAGLFLFIAFYAGSLTMFKEPIDRWVTPPIERMKMIEIDQYDALIDQVMVTFPQARQEFTLHFSDTENVIAPLSWYPGDVGKELKLSSGHHYASLDQNNQLSYQEKIPSALAELIDLLHRTAGIPYFMGDDYLGVYILGVAAIVYFLALVSGVIILLPTLVRSLFSLRIGKTAGRFWLDAHNIIGVTSLPFHIVISLTAIIFAFHDQFYDALETVVYKEQPMFIRADAPIEVYPIDKLLPIATLIKIVGEEAPNMAISKMDFFSLDSANATVRVAISSPQHMVSGAYTGYLGLNPYTGMVTMSSMLPGKEGLWGGIVSKFFSLHFGSFGGAFVRWIYFGLGLAGAFIFYSGNLLWLEKRRKKQKFNNAAPVQKVSCKILANLTVGVCLGSIAGVAISLISTKWLYHFAYQSNQASLFIYYFVFVFAISWAFWRGAARSAVDLLMLCGAACFLIPVTSVAAHLVNTPTLWANTNIESFVIDGMGLLLSCLFLYLAKLTHKRAVSSTTDSVWSEENAPEKVVIATQSC